MGLGRRVECQGENMVLNLGDHTAGHVDLLRRTLDCFHSVEAKELGVRRPIH